MAGKRKFGKDIVVILGVVLISTLAIWLPFSLGWKTFLGFNLGEKGFATIVANYDGPNYIIAAKTLYKPELIRSQFSLPIPASYFPAHFPLFPLLIRLWSIVLPGTLAMLAVTLISTGFLAVVFYWFLEKFQLSKHSRWLTVVLLFLPARIWAVRTVGSPEPLFMALVLLSLACFKEKRYFWAGIWGAAAQLTKSPGILLWAAYLVYFAGQHLKIRKLPKLKSLAAIHFRAQAIFFIPLAALGVFAFYQVQTGDFWAYFHSGDNFHLTSLPFQVFNSARTWLSGIWVEDLIWLYWLGILGALRLFKKQPGIIAIFGAVFLTATFFVAHRDLTRYSLPLWPLILIGFEKYLARKEFKIAFWLILPALYFYTLNFVAGNVFPISDWAPYL